MDNVVTNLSAKFDDDRLQYDKALGLTTRTTTFLAFGDPFPGLKRVQAEYARNYGQGGIERVA